MADSCRSRVAAGWRSIVVCLAMLMNASTRRSSTSRCRKIQHDLHFTQAGLAWVIDAYLVAFAGFLLLAGALGDLVGRKKVFLIGLAMFTAASLVCGLADSQGAADRRALRQGMSGALSTSVILAIIATEFPDQRERARAMSAYIFVAVGGGSIGLLAGGAHHPGAQLALDLLHQPADRRRRVRARRRFSCDENEGLGIRRASTWSARCW